MKAFGQSHLLTCALALVVLTLCAAFAVSDRPVFERGRRGCERAQLERNERTVVAFYTTAFNRGRPAEAVAKYVGEDEQGNKLYTQHNPQAADGPQAFIEFVTGFKTQYPELNVDVVRVIAECELVVTHSHLTLSPGDRGTAGADIFRLDAEGKIVEHWDVLQPVPETAANDNGMF